MPFHRKHVVNSENVFSNMNLDIDLVESLSGGDCPPQIFSIFSTTPEKLIIHYIESDNDCIRLTWDFNGSTVTTRYKPSLSFITIQVCKDGAKRYTIQMDKRVDGIVESISTLLDKIFFSAQSRIERTTQKD